MSQKKKEIKDKSMDIPKRPRMLFHDGNIVFVNHYIESKNGQLKINYERFDNGIIEEKTIPKRFIIQLSRLAWYCIKDLK